MYTITLYSVFSSNILHYSKEIGKTFAHCCCLRFFFFAFFFCSSHCHWLGKCYCVYVCILFERHIFRFISISVRKQRVENTIKRGNEQNSILLLFFLCVKECLTKHPLLEFDGKNGKNPSRNQRNTHPTSAKRPVGKWQTELKEKKTQKKV